VAPLEPEFPLLPAKPDTQPRGPDLFAQTLAMAQANPPAPGRLAVIITYLEMTAPPARPAAVMAPLAGAEIVTVRRPSLEAYRHLYTGVGEPWLWSDRRRLSNRELAAIIHDPRIELLVLMAEGHPAGYAELDHRKAATVGLSYFGLFPHMMGKGLGPWLLDHALERAWSGGPLKVLVNTCTFDHPNALGVYQSRGFVPVRHVRREIADPRLDGILPLNAAPHIPLAL